MKKMGSKRIIAICCIAVLLCGVVFMSGCGNDAEDNNAQIEKIVDLNGRNVSVIMDSMNAQQVKARDDIPDANILYETKQADGLSKLLTGKTDAFVIDNVNAQEIVRKYESLVILDEALDDDYYGYAFGKDSTIREEFNRYLKGMMKSGRLDEIINGWIEGKSGNTPQPKQTWEGSNGTIVCGMDNDSAPMCSVNKEGQLIGIDVDVILEIAEKLDYKVEFVSSDFGNIIASVAAGDFDMGASGLTISPEREELVAFSDPYMSASTVIVVRNELAVASTYGLFYSIKEAFYKVFVENARWADLLRGFGMTVFVSVTSMILGLIFGVLLFIWFYSGSKIAQPIIKFVTRIIGLMPTMIWLMVVYYIVYAGNNGNGLMAAITAFTFSFGVATCGNMRVGLGTLPVGQSEAAFSMGYTKFGAMFNILIPQAMGQILGLEEVDVIGLIKGTCLVELVAVMDVQAVADIILAETGVPFLPVVLPAITYVIFAGVVSKLMRILCAKLTSKEKTPEEIKAKIMKGRL